jgi:cell division protein ZapA
MAALMVADELSEVTRRVRRLEEELTALQDARVVAAERAKDASNAVVNAFNSAAERLEGITRKLNQTLGEGGGGVAIG